MEMKRLAVVLSFVCCGAGAAKADWQYTAWGMSPQQVVSASKDLARQGTDLRPDSDGNVSKLVAPYRSGNFTFEAQFGFDAADRLRSVTLVLNDRSSQMDMTSMTADPASAKPDAKSATMDQDVCHDLQASVDATYGPPQGGGIADMLYTIETWQDQKNQNNVKYTVLYGTGCFIQYSAIRPPVTH